MVTKHVVVLPYDEQWEHDFIIIRDEIRLALGELAQNIEHIGSTAVPGLSAKPIIDIDIVIKDCSMLDDVISALNEIGYCHEGNLGIAGREAFAYEGKDHLQKHHLYVCLQDSPELKRHICNLMDEELHISKEIDKWILDTYKERRVNIYNFCCDYVSELYDHPERWPAKHKHKSQYVEKYDLIPDDSLYWCSC